VGLPLLYASGYFLPISRGGGAYLLPSHDLFQAIVLPTLVLVVLGAILMAVASLVTRAWIDPRVATIGAVIVLSLLSLVALKGLLNAAGYEWQESVPRGTSDLRESLLQVRLILFSTTVLSIWAARFMILRITRLLSSIGFAFAVLMIIRLLSIAYDDHDPPIRATKADANHHTMQSNVNADQTVNASVIEKKRRVVWVVFDETDYRRAFGDESLNADSLVNFKKLMTRSAFATNANSPASATLYSIPALLMGTPISGQGLRIDKASNLWVESNGKWIPFSEETSIFGSLASSDRKASVLGFFHPYCKIFLLARCDSFTWPEVGGPFAAIWSNIPVFAASALGHPDPWVSITEKTLQLLPQYLARDDALTYIHLNIPHLPASYADRYLHLAPSGAPLTEYSRNLLLSDHILGAILDQLEAEKERHEVLLVVSTDHWLRNRWYRANSPEVSRPILFSAWKVGETHGVVLAEPVSTVNTASMILRYLDGTLTTEADIAQWWASEPVYPSFIAPNT